jgi:hypothetical protein
MVNKGDGLSDDMDNDLVLFSVDGGLVSLYSPG